MRGPNANPNMYMVSGRTATVRLTLNSVMNAEVAGTVTDEENVLQLIMTSSAGIIQHASCELLSTYIKKAKKHGTAV